MTDNDNANEVFNKWAIANGKNPYHDNRIPERLGFDVAWKHQQSKIDELQRRLDIVAAVVQLLGTRFKSGNEVPVDRAQISRKEYLVLEEALKAGNV